MSSKEFENDIAEAKKKLTDKQLKFADSYVMGLSERDAVRAAGYKMADDDNWRRDAYRLAKRNLNSDKVRKYITLLRDQMASNLVVDQLYVTEWLKRFVEDVGVNDNVRLKALELIGKNQKMFTDKVETSTDSNDPAELMRKTWELKQKNREQLRLVKRGEVNEA